MGEANTSLSLSRSETQQILRPAQGDGTPGKHTQNVVLLMCVSMLTLVE